MLLVFPSTLGFPVNDSEVSFIRSLDKNKFNHQLEEKLKEGWVVHEMNCSFRKTLFGGSTAYFAELRRGNGTGEEK